MKGRGYLMSKLLKILFATFLLTTAVFAEDELEADVSDEIVTEEAAANIAEPTVQKAAIGGKHADFLNQAAMVFKDGVFTNPAYEDVNARFPMSFKMMMGINGKFFASWYYYRKIYMDAEKALVAETTEDAELDMFRMAYAYEMLSCIADFYVLKKKAKVPSDTTIDNSVLKNFVSQKVQHKPAELWKFVAFANKEYLSAKQDFKSRAKFAKGKLGGTSMPLITVRWGLVYKLFNDYREGKHANRKEIGRASCRERV
jgi:hypothetical protein